MRMILWALRGLIFFTLFAFALNNDQPAVVHWFFGAQWKAPMVIVVLVAFAGGASFGVLAMVPSWWRHRRVAKRHAPRPAEPQRKDSAQAVAAESNPEHPPREGL